MPFYATWSLKNGDSVDAFFVSGSLEPIAASAETHFTGFLLEENLASSLM